MMLEDLQNKWIDENLAEEDGKMLAVAVSVGQA